LTTSGNVMLRIFGSMREDTTGGWRKMHNEELGCTLHQISLR
jgi:hypothetical protein